MIAKHQCAPHERTCQCDASRRLKHAAANARAVGFNGSISHQRVRLCDGPHHKLGMRNQPPNAHRAQDEKSHLQ